MLDLRNAENVVIIGGGTAGWLSSFFMLELFPRATITVIESLSVSTVGVGEGTYRNFRAILDRFSINEDEFFKETEASIKLGIGYRNWKKDSSDYIHFFHDHLLTKLSKIKVNGIELAWPLIGYNSSHIPSSSPYQKFIDEKCSDLNQVINYIRENDLKTRYGYHFNAKKVADYFKKLAIKKGISYITGHVNEIQLTENKGVSSILLEDGRILETDLVIDCTGMRRAISSKVDGFEFKKFDHLLVDQALGFFLPHEVTGFSLLTEAIALKNGWMWIIPTQTRSGCGYVYSSKHCSEEEAKQEIQQYFGSKIDFPISHKFEAGAQTKPFNKNVVSIGLASGFVEPLEATSIAQTISQLNDFATLVTKSGYAIPQKHIDYLNERTFNAFSEAAKFIHMHYLGGREDTNFWKDMASNANNHNELNQIVASLKTRLPRDIDSSSSHTRPQLYFTEFSYFSIYRSLGLISDQVIFNEISAIDSSLLQELSGEIKSILSTV
ncbi:tryptophan 7-halogenase [Endozoicomonas sp. SM1973]|uniref:Tryptophan 7-halogenase n=1 Tax=Spartinivicinus marinus TaxID=2994442 RepID=A0A853ICZ5_9GAMM|nr:tryptophan 7-halogenase [Spartinivicinus marinus]NYZ69732.1 tryptophan 7-halogenase [Spartinivicinus marinus]